MRIILVILLAALRIGAASAAPEKLTYAVLPLKSAQGVLPGEADILTDRLRNELFNTSKVDVMERDQMQEVLKEQGFQKSGACTDEACMVEIGKLLGVRRLVAGSLGKLGGLYMINIRGIDVQSGKIVRAVSKDVKGGIEDVVRVLRDIAVQLVCSPGEACDGQRPQEAKPAEDDRGENSSAPAAVTPGGKVYLERIEFANSQLGFDLDSGDADDLNEYIRDGLDEALGPDVYISPKDKLSTVAGNQTIIVRIGLDGYSTKPARLKQIEGTGTVTVSFYRGIAATAPAYSVKITATGDRHWGQSKPFANLFEAVGKQIKDDLGNVDFIKKLNRELR